MNEDGEADSYRSWDLNLCNQPIAAMSPLDLDSFIVGVNHKQ